MAPSIFIFCFFFFVSPFWPLLLFALFAREICACLPFGLSARMLHGFRRDLFSAPLPSPQSRPFRIASTTKGNSNSKSPSRNLDTHPVRTLDALRVRELDISQGFLNLPTGNAQPPKGFPSWRVLIFSIVDVLRIAHKQQMKSRRARVKLGLN